MFLRGECVLTNDDGGDDYDKRVFVLRGTREIFHLGAKTQSH